MFERFANHAAGFEKAVFPKTELRVNEAKIGGEVVLPANALTPVGKSARRVRSLYQMGWEDTAFVATENVKFPGFEDEATREKWQSSVDLLRTKVLRALDENDWSRVAIVSPRKRGGTTFVATSLAKSLARIGDYRVVLADLNLRAPAVHKAFGIDWQGDIFEFLSGEIDVSDYAVRTSESLALVLNSSDKKDSADTLLQRSTSDAFDQIELDLLADVILYDVPALLEHDDCFAILPDVDAVLMVAEAGSTSAGDIIECERQLAGKIPLLGVVLNNAV